MIAGSETVHAFIEEKATEPVELDLPHPVDAGQSATDLGKVAVDAHRDARAGVLLGIVWLRFLGGESWRSTIVISVLTTAAFYGLFLYALSVPLPHLIAF